MKILKIELNNICSYKSSTIEFDDQNIIGIFGRDDVGRAIGTGKSAFVNSIIFALYGVYPNRKTDDIIREGTDNANVKLDFVVDNKNYSIERILKKNNYSIVKQAVLIYDGVVENKISIINEKIISILGVNYELFFNRLFFVQDSIFKFTGAKHKEKIDYLATLCNIDILQKSKDLVTIDRKKMQTHYNKWNNLNDFVKNEIKKTIYQIKLINKNPILLEKSRTERALEYINNDVSNKKIYLLEKLQNIEKEIDKLKNDQIDFFWHVNFIEKNKNEINALTDQIAELDLKKRTYDLMLIEKSNYSVVVTSVCPVCKTHLTNEKIAKINNDNSSFVSLIDSKIKKIKTEISSIDILKSKYNEIKRKYEISKYYIEKNSNKEFEIKKLIEQRQLVLTQIESVTNQDFKNNKEDLQKQLNKIINLESELKILKTNLIEFLSKNKKLKNKIKILSDRIKLLNSIEFDYSKDGLQKKIIMNTIKLVEKKTNEILNDLLPEKKIKFVLEGDKEIFNILVNNRDYNTFSIGQKVILTFAIRLAFDEYIILNSGNKINFIVLDEVFSYLDEYSIDLIMKLLLFLTAKYQQIFVITHNNLLDDVFPFVLKVNFHEKISNIYWEKG